jgi:uncharacterized protein (TIGR02147 family)
VGAILNVFEFDNYREFLKVTFESMKAKDSKFSFRFFARVAGFSSHNTLWNVIKGRSNLSESSIAKITTALKFNKEESHYFKNLVLLNQAQNSELKEQYSKEIFRSKAYRRFHPLRESQLRYYTHWYYVVIREMVNLPEFREDPEWIANNTLPPVTPLEATQALEELIKLGLLSRDDKGKLSQSETIVSTADEVTSALVAGFHREFMKKAGEAIDLVPRAERDISSVTFRVSAQTMQSIKEKVQNFRRALIDEASRDQTPESIYQLNFQLFPVTQTKKRGGQKS